MALHTTSRAASDFDMPAAATETEPTPRRRSPGLRRLKRIGWNLIPPLTFVAIVGLWSLAIQIFKIPAYLLPGPGAVFQRLVVDAGMLWLNAKVTLTEIVLGFALTVLAAIPLGLVIALSPLARQALYPPIMLLQLVPKIAIAPLFVVWFGFGLFPKVLLTFLLCFFPTLVASMTGFRALDERVLYLTRSMGASAWQTFRYVRVPAALTYIFSGLKVSAVFAATGAIVGEFVGANAGLGYLLLRGTSFLDMPLIFACLVALSIVGILFSYIVDGLEVLLMPWQRKG